MTTTDMVNLIRANNQPLSHKALRAIADRLVEQDAYLRSALATLNTQGQVVTDQEEQLRGLGGELAESERHRQIMTVQNSELLARCDLLAQELGQQEKQIQDLGGALTMEVALSPLIAWDIDVRQTSIIMGPAEIMLESPNCTVVAEDFDRIREALQNLLSQVIDPTKHKLTHG